MAERKSKVFRVRVVINGADETRLVRAKGAAQAKEFVAASCMAISEATPEDCIRHGAEGKAIEEAEPA